LSGSMSTAAPLPFAIISSAIGLLLLVDASSLLFAFYKQNSHIPLKAKNLRLIALLMFGSACFRFGFIFGEFPVFNYFNAPGSVKTSYLAIIIAQIFYVCLGIFLPLHITVLRFHLLYEIFIMGRQITWKTYMLPTLGLYLPVCLFNILMAFNIQNIAFVWNEQQQVYKAATFISGINVVFVFIYIVAVCHYNLKLKKIVPAFNEYQETLVITFCVLFNMGYILVMMYFKPMDALNIKYCTLILFTLTFDIFYWTIMGRPLYNCLFHPVTSFRSFRENAFAVKMYNACDYSSGVWPSSITDAESGSELAYKHPARLIT